MTHIYSVLKDYKLDSEAPDVITRNPACVIAIWGYKTPLTYSRFYGKSSPALNVGDAHEIKDVMVIRDDITNASTGSSKSGSITNFSCTLKPSINYTSRVFPGDYIACWMVNNTEDADVIVNRLYGLDRNEPLNTFLSGLKFFGKVDSCRKTQQLHAFSGTRTSSVAITATGFNELNASVYYEPFLANKQIGDLPAWLLQFGINLNDIVNKTKKGITTDSIVPLLLSVFFGNGVPTTETQGTVGNVQVTQGANSPDFMVVPDEIGQIFGLMPGSGTKPGGKLGYLDLLNTWIGVQKYTRTSKENDAFCPAIRNDTATPSNTTTIYKTSHDLQGSFNVSSPPASGLHTCWSFIGQYYNPAINDKYVTLRVAPDGNIYPTLILRQLPFSSGQMREHFQTINTNTPQERTVSDTEASGDESAENPRPDSPVRDYHIDVPVTRYTELPVWDISDILIKNLSVGRSDALRINYVLIQAETPKTGINTTVGQLVQNPPISDQLDIMRHGFRPSMATVKASLDDGIAKNTTTGWMRLAADMRIGQQMSLTGTVSTYGIQSPICIGDNTIIDNTLFHIEQVSHTFAVSPVGGHTFDTTLSLTYGVEIDAGTEVFGNTDKTDLTKYDAAIMSVRNSNF